MVATPISLRVCHDVVFDLTNESLLIFAGFYDILLSVYNKNRRHASRRYAVHRLNVLVFKAFLSFARCPINHVHVITIHEITVVGRLARLCGDSGC